MGAICKAGMRYFLLLLALVLALVVGSGQAQPGGGIPGGVQSMGVGNAALVPLMSVYDEAQREAEKAQLKADFMKTAKLGDSDITASLAGGDGELDASQAQQKAKQAVEGVEAAKRAMATASSALAQAELAAQQSQADAAHAADEDKHDMSNIVSKAVSAAQTAEGLKIETLKKERQRIMEKKDAAYRQAMDVLDKKRDEVMRLGDADIAANNEKLRQFAAAGPAHITKAISDKMQEMSSETKLSALSSELLSSMGQQHSDTDQAVEQMSDEDVGEALPDKMSRDEDAFDKVLNEMKQAQKKMHTAKTPEVQRVQRVDPKQLEQLAAAQVSISGNLAATANP